MKKSIFILMFIFVNYFNVSSQRYNFAGGLKVGDGVALSAVGRFADKYTAELTLKPNVFSDYSLATLNVKRHYPILGSKRFNVYGGAGMFYRSQEFERQDETGDAVGLSMMVGAEFTAGRINISTDYNPMFTFNDTELTKKYYGYSGISVRYVFAKRETKAQKWVDKTRDKFKKNKK